MKVTIIYDCPLRQCDKLWVKNELEARGYNVKTVAPCVKISHVEQKGKAGKILARLLTLWQCIKALCVSKSGEAVFCWSQWSGLLFNALPGSKKRFIISYNWLTPMSGNTTKSLYVNALQNKKLVAVVNSESTKGKLQEAYGVSDMERIACIPDVYDDSCEFLAPAYKSGERYCFTGGRANRDWKTFLEIAGKCPEIQFRGVAAESDWNRTLEIPENVKIYFDTSPEEYYQLMKGAYLTLYPLEKEVVSGLINIVKSAQLGKPVLITDMPVTRMYYPDSLQGYLPGFADADGFAGKVREIFGYSKEQYEREVLLLQQYIQENFSPIMAGKKIAACLRTMEEGKKGQVEKK